MKLLIAGLRDYSDYSYVKKTILSIYNINGIKEIVSGGATGVDTLAEQFAKEYSIPFKCFPANWKEYGKSAGPIRNIEMANYCDKAILFWDNKSKGTGNMLSNLKKYKKEYKVFIVR